MNGNIEKFQRNGYQRDEEDFWIQKRCILKQLYDYHINKGYLQKNSIYNVNQNEYYKQWYADKWSKINEYTENDKELHFTIKCKGAEKKGKYKEFLSTPQDMCSTDYKSISMDNITVTT